MLGGPPALSPTRFLPRIGAQHVGRVLSWHDWHMPLMVCSLCDRSLRNASAMIPHSEHAPC